MEVETDEKGRPSLTPICPIDEKGMPVLSDEVRTLMKVLHSSEVVLNPVKPKEVL